MAVQRAACSDMQREARTARRHAPDALRGGTVYLDGYNVLTGVEAALAGGVLVRCRDGAVRDLASVHGSFRKVAETQPALERIGALLADYEPAQVHWLLDQPVSNSGRLKARLQQTGRKHGWAWDVSVVESPDATLKEVNGLVATADSAILDAAVRWVDVVSTACARMAPSPWMIDLDASAGPAHG